MLSPDLEAIRRIWNVLLDRRLFQLDEDPWNRFTEALDAPARSQSGVGRPPCPETAVGEVKGEGEHRPG
jgi:hypothetical protein